MSSPHARRRQRSTRLTVAVALIAFAALAVAGAVLSGSWLLVTVAAVLAVLLGASATRITHSELLQTRRDAARDRAEQAQAYHDLTVARTAEHARYTSAMQLRADHQAHALSELEVALSAAQRRAASATLKMNAEARRADVAEQTSSQHLTQLEEARSRAADAALRVTELEQEILVLRAELEAWQTEPVRRHA